MSDMEALLGKGGVKVFSKPDLPAPQCTLPITSFADARGVVLTIGQIPDSYFTDGPELKGFVGAGLAPDLFDCQVEIKDHVLTLKQGVKSTSVLCSQNAFSAVVSQLGVGDGPFYVRYTFGPSNDVKAWQFSQPLIASYRKEVVAGIG